MPWTLTFESQNIDQRIEVRAALAQLRESNAVQHVERVERSMSRWEGITTTIEVYWVDFREDAMEIDWAPLGWISERWGSRVPDQIVNPVSFPSLPDALRRLADDVRRSGRTPVERTLVRPLRPRLDYHSIGRRTLQVEQLPEGALSSYDRDLGVSQVVTEGFDANGSPIAGHDMPPSWVQVGQWAYNARLDTYVRITRREPYNPRMSGVQARVWRSDEEPRWFNIDYFHNGWTPCDAPEEPRPIWLRLLGDDPL